MPSGNRTEVHKGKKKKKKKCVHTPIHSKQKISFTFFFELVIAFLRCPFSLPQLGWSGQEMLH
ncbi:hypothetical protein QG37_03050 [Candidozyma auris]|nr:hypothetical protein QG37_03050 [[Candida] auris]